MRAALHELQQRLGQCHNGPGGVRVAVTACPAPSTEYRIRRKLFQKLTQFLHPFYFLSAYSADK